MKQRQTLQNYKTSSTRHNFQAKIKYYTILETSEAVLFDEMMKSKKILHMCSQNGVVTLMWLTLYVLFQVYDLEKPQRLFKVPCPKGCQDF